MMVLYFSFCCALRNSTQQERSRSTSKGLWMPAQLYPVYPY